LVFRSYLVTRVALATAVLLLFTSGVPVTILASEPTLAPGFSNDGNLPSGPALASSPRQLGGGVGLTFTDTLASGLYQPDVFVGPPTQVSPGDVSAMYIAGQSYWGRNQYIEYIAGNLPIIISAPHGGSLQPDEIPDRTYGSTGKDTYSLEYTLEVAGYITQLTGGYPHVIINHLHRIKLDANRGIGEAAQGNPYAEQAWHEFHGFIEDAKASVYARYGRGHYFDFHTNGHDEDQWIEFGYLLTAYDLDRSDAELNGTYYKDKSSIKSLAYATGVDFPQLVRGGTSLGGLLQSRGYKCVPSPAYPDPDGGGFYSGGYNTLYHGSRLSGTIDGTQVETYWALAKDSERDAYSLALARTIVDFVDNYYGFELRDWPFQTYLPLIHNRE
jgi:hypothetical protein